jgi:hypothetical protein
LKQIPGSPYQGIDEAEVSAVCATCTDPRGRNFEAVLRHELAKISAFYADKENELEVLCAAHILQLPCRPRRAFPLASAAAGRLGHDRPFTRAAG